MSFSGDGRENENENENDDGRGACHACATYESDIIMMAKTT